MSSPRAPARGQGTPERDVNSELRSVVQRKPAREHFDGPLIVCGKRSYQGPNCRSRFLTLVVSVLDPALSLPAGAMLFGVCRRRQECARTRNEFPSLTEGGTNVRKTCGSTLNSVCCCWCSAQHTFCTGSSMGTHVSLVCGIGLGDECCQPCFHSPGSPERGGGGRTPSRKRVQVGRFTQNCVPGQPCSRIVVLAGEIGGWWSAESRAFVS